MSRPLVPASMPSLPSALPGILSLQRTGQAGNGLSSNETDSQAFTRALAQARERTWQTPAAATPSVAAAVTAPPAPAAPAPNPEAAARDAREDQAALLARRARAEGERRAAEPAPAPRQAAQRPDDAGAVGSGAAPGPQAPARSAPSRKSESTAAADSSRAAEPRNGRVRKAHAPGAAEEDAKAESSAHVANPLRHTADEDAPQGAATTPLAGDAAGDALVPPAKDASVPSLPATRPGTPADAAVAAAGGVSPDNATACAVQNGRAIGGASGVERPAADINARPNDAQRTVQTARSASQRAEQLLDATATASRPALESAAAGGPPGKAGEAQAAAAIFRSMPSEAGEHGMGGAAGASAIGGVPALAAATAPAQPTFAWQEAKLDSAPGSPSFSRELGTQVSILVREGVQHARLQLNPQELGPVWVQIQLEGQAAQVHMAAESPLTRQALEQALPTLASQLSEAGITLSGGGVSSRPDGGSGGGLGFGAERRDGSGTHAGTAQGGRNASNAAGALPPDAGHGGWARARGIVDLIA